MQQVWPALVHDLQREARLTMQVAALIALEYKPAEIAQQLSLTAPEVRTATKRLERLLRPPTVVE